MLTKLKQRKVKLPEIKNELEQHIYNAVPANSPVTIFILLWNWQCQRSVKMIFIVVTERYCYK